MTTSRICRVNSMGATLPALTGQVGQWPPGGDRRHRRELLAVQRRTADQRAVDVVLGHDVADVLGVGRPAVQDPHAVGDLLRCQVRPARRGCALHIS